MSPATKAEPPLAEAPPAPSVIYHEPLRIDPDDRKPRQRVPTKRYWIGLILNAPMENCTIGGVTYQKRVGNIEYETDGSIKNPAAVRLGDILELTEEQLQVSMQRISSTYVRTTRSPEGRVTSSRQISTKWLDAAGKWVPDPRNEPIQGDEPLGAFIYIQRVTEGVHVARDLGSPLPVPLVR